MPVRIHLLGLAAFTTMLTLMVAQPVLPLYLQARGLPPLEVGLISGLLSAALIVTELSAMVVSGRLGRRGALVLASVGSAAAQLWFALAAARWEWYASRILFGAFRGIIWPIVFAEVAEAAPPGRQARAFSIFWAYFGLGLLIGPGIGGEIADHLGLRAPLLLSGLLALGPLLLTGAISTGRDASGSMVRALLAVGRRPVVVRLWAMTALNTTVHGLYATFLPLYASAHGLSPGDIGLIFVLGAAAFTAAQVLAGRAAERFAPVAVLAPAYVLRGLSIGAVPLTAGFAGLAALSVLASMAGAVIPTTLSSRLAAAAPPEHGVTAMGGFNASADLGLFVGPVLGGVVAGAGLAWPFLLAIPLAVIAALLPTAQRRGAPAPGARVNAPP